MEKDCQYLSWENAPIGPLLGHAAHLARERMDVRLARYDVTPAQTHVLLYLGEQSGPTPQRDVVEHLRVKPPTANGILDRLEEKKLICRRADPEDLRQKRVCLTEKGRELRMRLLNAFQEGAALTLHGLSEEETAVLRGLLNRIIQNLEEDRISC